MPGTLTHSPADVARQLLIDLGLGTEPSAGSSWPVFAEGEPDSPDDCVTVYDTAGTIHGRDQVGGEVQEHHGVQVRVRAAKHVAGYTKARALAVALDETVYQDVVVIGAVSYLVHAATRTSEVLSLGVEAPDSKRVLFTINALMSLREI